MNAGRVSQLARVVRLYRVILRLTGKGGSNLSHVLEVSPQVLSSRLGGCKGRIGWIDRTGMSDDDVPRFRARAVLSGLTLLRVGGKGGGSVSDLREEKRGGGLISLSSRVGQGGVEGRDEAHHLEGTTTTSARTGEHKVSMQPASQRGHRTMCGGKGKVGCVEEWMGEGRSAWARRGGRARATS